MERMRSQWMLGALGASAMIMGTGCIIVSAKKAPVMAHPDRQAVVKDGQLYIVDLGDGSEEHVPWESERVEKVEVHVKTEAGRDED